MAECSYCGINSDCITDENGKMRCILCNETILNEKARYIRILKAFQKKNRKYDMGWDSPTISEIIRTIKNY